MSHSNGKTSSTTTATTTPNKNNNRNTIKQRRMKLNDTKEWGIEEENNSLFDSNTTTTNNSSSSGRDPCSVGRRRKRQKKGQQHQQPSSLERIGNDDSSIHALYDNITTPPHNKQKSSKSRGLLKRGFTTNTQQPQQQQQQRMGTYNPNQRYSNKTRGGKKIRTPGTTFRRGNQNRNTGDFLDQVMENRHPGQSKSRGIMQQQQQPPQHADIRSKRHRKRQQKQREQQLTSRVPHKQKNRKRKEEIVIVDDDDEEEESASVAVIRNEENEEDTSSRAIHTAATSTPNNKERRASWRSTGPENDDDDDDEESRGGWEGSSSMKDAIRKATTETPSEVDEVLSAIKSARFSQKPKNQQRQYGKGNRLHYGTPKSNPPLNKSSFVNLHDTASPPSSPQPPQHKPYLSPQRAKSPIVNLGSDASPLPNRQSSSLTRTSKSIKSPIRKFVELGTNAVQTVLSFTKRNNNATKVSVRPQQNNDNSYCTDTGRQFNNVEYTCYDTNVDEIESVSSTTTSIKKSKKGVTTKDDWLTAAEYDSVYPEKGMKKMNQTTKSSNTRTNNSTMTSNNNNNNNNHSNDGWYNQVDLNTTTEKKIQSTITSCSSSRRSNNTLKKETDEDWVSTKNRTSDLYDNTITTHTMPQKKNSSVRRSTRQSSRLSLPKRKQQPTTIDMLDDSSSSDSSEDEALVKDGPSQSVLMDTPPHPSTTSSSNSRRSVRLQKFGDRKRVDAVRIAIGKQVVSSNCVLEFQPGVKVQYLSINYNSEKKHRITLDNFTAINELKYFLSPDDEENDEMSFLAMRVTPNAENQLPIEQKESLIVVEVRSTDQFKTFLESMKQNKVLSVYMDNAGLQYSDTQYTSALLKAKKREDEERRKSANRKRSSIRIANATNYKNNTKQQRTKMYLVYPFLAHPSVFLEASESLNIANVIPSASNTATTTTSSKEEKDEDKQEQDFSESTVKGRTHLLTILDDDYDRLLPGEFLNDTLIDFWMKWMFRNEDAHCTDVHYFTTQFFSKLEEGPDAVASWTAKKNINVFEKKFIIIPINNSLHWSLCVVVNPGKIENGISYLEGEYNDYDTNQEAPFLLFFDSLKAHKKATVHKHVTKWLDFEAKRLNKFANRARPFSTKIYKKNPMGIYSPRVPYQENCCDCGVFVCRYAFGILHHRNYRFTFEDIKTNMEVITESKYFQFGMNDIKVHRKEMKVLVKNLAQKYTEIKLKEKQLKKQVEEKEDKKEKSLEEDDKVQNNEIPRKQCENKNAKGDDGENTIIARLVHNDKNDSKEIVASILTKESKCNSHIGNESKFESKIAIKEEEDLTKNEYSKGDFTSVVPKGTKCNSHIDHEISYESKVPIKKEENITIMGNPQRVDQHDHENRYEVKKVEIKNKAAIKVEESESSHLGKYATEYGSTRRKYRVTNEENNQNSDNQDLPIAKTTIERLTEDHFGVEGNIYKSLVTDIKEEDVSMMEEENQMEQDDCMDI